MAQTHHYLFDTSGTYNDATGSSNFTNVYGSIYSGGLINQCYQIASYNLMDSVNAYTSANLLPTSGAFSVAFWIKSWGTGSGGGTALQLGTTGIFFRGYAKYNEFAVGQTTPTFQTKSVYSAFDNVTWHHLAFVYNGSTWTIYVNGSVPTQYGTNFTPNSATYNASTQFQIAGDVSGGGYYIDDLRVYNSAIDSTEVTFLYNGGSGTQSDSGGGGGGSATQLSVVTQPTRSYSTKNIATQPVVNLLTSGGTVDGSATNTVFANVVSGAGAIGGSTSVSATSGVATFSGLSVTGFGPIGLGFTASGLTAAYATSFLVDIPVPVRPIRSETSGLIPTSGQLQIGELAINIADQKGYVKKADGTIATVWQAGSSLTSGYVTSGYIGNAAVVSGSIGSGQIGTFHLASGVGGGGASLTSGSVTSGYIGNAAIVSGSVGSGQIGTIHFSSGSVTKFTSSASAPSSPSEGDRWYYTTDGILLTYVNDGSSSQWVQF
jgi:hypothetical protein